MSPALTLSQFAVGKVWHLLHSILWALTSCENSEYFGFAVRDGVFRSLFGVGVASGPTAKLVVVTASARKPANAAATEAKAIIASFEYVLIL